MAYIFWLFEEVVYVWLDAGLTSQWWIEVSRITDGWHILTFLGSCASSVGCWCWCHDDKLRGTDAKTLCQNEGNQWPDSWYGTSGADGFTGLSSLLVVCKVSL